MCRDTDLAAAEKGTVRRDGRGQDPYLIHTVDGASIAPRFRRCAVTTESRRLDWQSLGFGRRRDFKPRPTTSSRNGSTAIQWMRPKKKGKGDDYEFRSVTEDDLKRERIVEEYIGKHLAEWQAKGWIPDMRIEPGYNTDQPIRSAAGRTGITCSTHGSCLWLDSVRIGSADRYCLSGINAGSELE